MDWEVELMFGMQASEDAVNELEAFAGNAPLTHDIGHLDNALYCSPFVLPPPRAPSRSYHPPGESGTPYIQ